MTQQQTFNADSDREQAEVEFCATCRCLALLGRVNMGRDGEQKKCTKCKTGVMTWKKHRANKPEAWVCDNCEFEDHVWQRMEPADGRSGRTLPKRRTRR